MEWTGKSVSMECVLKKAAKELGISHWRPWRSVGYNRCTKIWTVTF